MIEQPLPWPTMSTAPDPVLTSAGYLLMKAGKLIDSEIGAALAADDLAPRQFLVLTFAGGDERLSQQELSQRLGLDPTLLVAVIDELEARGLASRVRDPDDRRRQIVRLTAAGRKVQRRATTALAKAEARFLAPVAEADRPALRRALHAAVRGHLPWIGDLDA
jgi:DNA-binding MarR family transcriptional regulator